MYQDGIYALRNEAENHPRLAHCNFSGNVGYDLVGMETPVGYVGVTSKQGGVAFSVIREATGSTQENIPNGIITFNREMANFGPAFNLDTGIFKSPVSGYFGFWFSAQTGIANSETAVQILKNGQVSYVIFDSNQQDNINNFNYAWQFHLKAGDEVKLNIAKGSLIVQISSVYPMVVFFTGQLIYEEF